MHGSTVIGSHLYGILVPRTNFILLASCGRDVVGIIGPRISGVRIVGLDISGVRIITIVMSGVRIVTVVMSNVRIVTKLCRVSESTLHFRGLSVIVRIVS